MRRNVLAIIGVVVLVNMSFGQAPDEHIVMGMPTAANANDKNDFLLKKKNFVLSYNNKKGTPNWVSWHLTKEHVGQAPRKDFHPDDELPAGLHKIFPADYKQSGFDRGHMCPHSDRSADDDMSFETFVMTNMVPQSPENNQKGWNQLELYGRALVARGKRELYIVSGPLGIGGEGKNGPRSKIGPGKVVVPAFTWKVIMVVPAGTHFPGDVKGDKTRLIAIKMPNDRSVNFDWAKYRCSVEDLEEDTGFKFFSAVTDVGFNEKKGEVDSVPIGPPIPVEHN